MDNDKDSKDNVENFYDIVADTLKEWTKKHCLEEKQLRNMITKQLNKNFEHIVYTSLGFTNKWGRWDIEKDRSSVIGDYILRNVSASVDAWVESKAKDINNLHLKPEMLDSLQKYAEETFIRHIKNYLGNRAICEADKAIQRMVDNVKLDEDKIKEGTKALEFISVFSKVAQPEDKEEK